jgi:hypothetical protein
LLLSLVAVEVQLVPFAAMRAGMNPPFCSHQPIAPSHRTLLARLLRLFPALLLQHGGAQRPQRLHELLNDVSRLSIQRIPEAGEACLWIQITGLGIALWESHYGNRIMVIALW